MARQVIESKIVNNATELITLVQRFANRLNVHLDELSIEEPVSLIETTLSDGSLVYDIHLGNMGR